MKKLLALLLCLVMAVSVFAGCGPTGTGGDGTTGGADGTTAPKVEQTLPDDITLTIGIPDMGLVDDFDTNALTLWIEDQTGYDLEFVKFLPSAADYKAKLSTMMVDGDPLPDMLVGFNLGRAFYQDLGDDGYLVDLAPFFENEKKSAAWWERINALDEDYRNRILVDLYDDDGADEVWAFPVIEQSDYDVMAYQMMINQEWLKNLNLEMPTDPESLYTVLKAFKEKDANGNGDPGDEIPLLGVVGSSYADPLEWIINMFVYSDDNNRWIADENDQLYMVHNSDKYREALIYVRKLVDEGLMSKNCWGLSGDTLKGLMAPVDGVATIGVVGMHCAGWPVDAPLLYQYAAMEYWGYGILNSNRNEWYTFITEDCEYPEAAWNVCMLMSSEEGGYRMRYGEKGVDWDDADSGTESFLGREAKIKVVNVDAASNGSSTWGTVYFGILTDAENECTQLGDDMTEWHKYRYALMRDVYDNYHEAAARKPENSSLYIKLTEDESDEIQAEVTNVKKVVNTARQSFCTGQSSDGKYTNPSDDAQWEAYKQELLDQGLETWREMVQAVYEDMYLN